MSNFEQTATAKECKRGWRGASELAVVDNLVSCFHWLTCGRGVILQRFDLLPGTWTMTHHVDLLPGQQLFSNPQSGQENLLFTPTRAFMLIMQGDGNLVYYAINDSLLDGAWSNIGDRTIYTEVVWASNANVGLGFDPRCIMQDDGNLVVYSGPTDHFPAWSSGTFGHPGEGAFLRPQDDGNLVIYIGNTPIWQSGTKAGGG
jgi:hypothetical protein